MKRSSNAGKKYRMTPQPKVGRAAQAIQDYIEEQRSKNGDSELMKMFEFAWKAGQLYMNGDGSNALGNAWWKWKQGEREP